MRRPRGGCCRWEQHPVQVSVLPGLRGLNVLLHVHPVSLRKAKAWASAEISRASHGPGVLLARVEAAELSRFSVLLAGGPGAGLFQGSRLWLQKP